MGPPLVIGLGPGLVAGRDVHYAIETMRGHDLGRIVADHREPGPVVRIVLDVRRDGVQPEALRRAFAGETVNNEISFPIRGEPHIFQNIISPIRDGGEIWRRLNTIYLPLVVRSF